MLRLLLVLILLAAVGFGAAFSYYNPQAVQVDWLAQQTELPLGVLLLGGMLAGFGLALLVLGPAWWVQRLRVRRLQKALLRQSGELDSLRALQADDPS